MLVREKVRGEDVKGAEDGPPLKRALFDGGTRFVTRDA